MTKVEPTFFKKLDKPIVGVTLNYATDGEPVNIKYRDFTNSEHENFFEYVENILNIFIEKPILRDSIYRFLIIIHKNLNSDIYINQFEYEIIARSKKDIKKNCLVGKFDITEIQSLHFPEIEINKEDCIVFCFKIGWRFGLFFDFAPAHTHENKAKVLDTESRYQLLGECYQNMLFFDELKFVSDENVIDEMFKDGWYPFIQLEKEFSTLYKLYANKRDIGERIGVFIGQVLDKFDKTKIECFTRYWWKNPFFLDRMKLINAGIEAFLQNDEAGYINAITQLYTQIDGIIRSEYHLQYGEKPSFKKLKEYIIDRGKSSFSGDNSIGFTSLFRKYLDDVVFSEFDIKTGKINFSRHMVIHGMARPDDYTKARALQAILTLDQIYFYLQNSKPLDKEDSIITR